jgi:hypothetical protein
MLDRIRALTAMLHMGEFTVSQVAERAGVAPGTVKQVIQREIRKGLVRKIGSEARARASTGGAPRGIYRLIGDQTVQDLIDRVLPNPGDADVYRIAPGTRRADLAAELDEEIQAMGPIGEPDQLSGGISESLLVAEDKLTRGLGAGAAAISAATTARDRASAVEDFCELLKGVGPDLAAAGRQTASDLPRLAAAQGAFNDAMEIAGPTKLNFAADRFPAHAKVAALIGASHSAALAARDDVCFAGATSLLWASRLSAKLVDYVRETPDSAQRRSMALVRRFMDIAGGAQAKTSATVVIDSVGQTTSTEKLLCDVLDATGGRHARATEYGGDSLASRVFVLGSERPLFPPSALLDSVPAGATLWIVDEGEHPDFAVLSKAEVNVEYCALVGSTPGEKIARLFKVAAAIRADACTQGVPVGSLNLVPQPVGRHHFYADDKHFTNIGPVVSDTSQPSDLFEQTKSQAAQIKRKVIVADWEASRFLLAGVTRDRIRTQEKLQLAAEAHLVQASTRDTMRLNKEAKHDAHPAVSVKTPLEIKPVVVNLDKYRKRQITGHEEYSEWRRPA